MTATVAFLFAHPDDETFSSACLIREIVERGGKPVLLSATRGDAGKTGLLGPMSKEELAVIREEELRTACELLGLTTIKHLGYSDGKVADIPREELVEHLISFLNEQQADIVITFPEDGVSGHKDHIAVHYAVNEAIASSRCPSVKKMYYCTFAGDESATFQMDVKPYWNLKVDALRAHASQHFSVQRVFGDLSELPTLPAKLTEPFILVWEKGKDQHSKREDFIF